MLWFRQNLGSHSSLVHSEADAQLRAVDLMHNTIF